MMVALVALRDKAAKMPVTNPAAYQSRRWPAQQLLHIIGALTHFAERLTFLQSSHVIAVERKNNVQQNADRRLPPGGNTRRRRTQ